MEARYKLYGGGLEIAGKPYAQPPFKYQVKCFDRLRKLYASQSGHEGLSSLLDETGCLDYLNA